MAYRGMAYRVPDFNFPEDFYLDDVGVWRLKKEKLAEMEKPKPMTNEEYLRSCSSDELVSILCELVDSGILQEWRIKYHCADSDEDAVRMWLKGIHK